MGRFYTRLECGCLISCDGGGALIPCENDSICCSFRYTQEHKFCEFCNGCMVCYDHANCVIYPGGENV